MGAGLTTKQIREMPPQERPVDVWDAELRGLIVRIQPSGVRTFYCSYRTRDGRKTRVRIGDAMVLGITDARKEAQKLLADVIRGSDPALERKKARVSSLRVFLRDIYGPWVVVNRKSGALTLRRLETCFAAILDRPLQDLSAWLLEKMRSDRRRAGICAATINRDLVALKACLSRAVEWGILDVHPLTKVRPLKLDRLGVIRYLTSEEEMRLRAALTARDAKLRAARISANKWRADRGYPLFPAIPDHESPDHLSPIVLLAINTGMRRGEIFQLRWENVCFRQRTVTVTAASAKGGNTRHLPLNREAQSALEAWAKQNAEPLEGLVFPGKNENPLNNFRRAWLHVLSAAQIEDFRFHDTRHHFASRLVMSGVDLNTIRELLGHSDLKMTLKYAHLAPSAKAAAVAKLDGRMQSA